MVDPSPSAAFTAFLSSVGAAPAAELLRTARQRATSPGELLVGDGQTNCAGVLIDGMLRTVVPLPDGRMATIHYLRPVAFFGLPTIFFSVPLRVYALGIGTVIDLQAQDIRRCARNYPEFGWFVSQQLAGAVCRVPSIVEEFGFKSISQRIASHLISFSEPDGHAAERIAHVTQTALAEYIGSAREVVSRCLRSLANQGAISIGHGWIRIVNEDRIRWLAEQPRR